MAHYAFIDENNVVTEVIVGRDENDIVSGVTDWATYYGEFKNQSCLRTSYNTFGGVHYADGAPSDDQTKAFRFNYAGIGYTYDPERDAFIPAKPYDSWVLDEDTCLWVAPVSYPDDGEPYDWDEESESWVAAPEAEVE